MDDMRYEYLTGDGVTSVDGWMVKFFGYWVIPTPGLMVNGYKYRRPIQPATNPAIKGSLTTDGPSPAPGTRAQWESDADGHKPIRPAPGSDTPLTDSVTFRHCANWSNSGDHVREIVFAEEMQKLERENTALRDEVRVLRECLQIIADTENGMDWEDRNQVFHLASTAKSRARCILSESRERL